MSDTLYRAASHAVVIGGSMAGMLAAAALADLVGSVELIDAHELPDGPEPRTGVPQAVHIHMLQTGGIEAIEELLPGSTDLLLAAGAHRIPVTTNMIVYSPEGWYRRWTRATHSLITASRDLTDSIIRRQILKHPRISARPHTKAVGLLGNSNHITGVRVRSADGTETLLRADLVIDASGRASRTPQWLTDLGIASPAEDRIDSGLVYASRFYRAPVPTRNWPVVAVQADPSLPRPANAGGILPVEGDRWHVSVMGAPGGQPTSQSEDFEPFARSLRHPIIADLVKAAEPLSDVKVTHSTVNRRLYYERLSPWPDGLVVLGDSAATFNPLYGQGMSVAAQGALALREVLSRGLNAGFARRAQRAIGRRIDTAWTLAVGTDIHFPTTTGQRPGLMDRMLRRYVSRLSHAATGSFKAATSLTDVLALQASPLSLVAPGSLLTAITGPLRSPLDRPQLTANERLLLESLEEAPLWVMR
ncbi:FAD-dependent monooxygenase [Streptomyces sp. CdTB01]|uniref:NAD(P)/FAD-dependent oxidoreductase n=1 Tax=Streptomyces sp. CdTB01 TaxID=1725411 RepID=UPI00073A6C7A|nr:FAD-dependent monooxygenase [Streptomyces sp. CdTB01]ALV30735.1 pyridine nucleotide-disulfide oxidoreductase [Streptomyces sp. CdTB01]